MEKASRWGLATGRWWRRRESNPRPQALRYRIYVRVHAYWSRFMLPGGRGKHGASSGTF